METTPMTVERAKKIVNFITSNFDDMIPRTCLRLYGELSKSKEEPTEKLVEWLNVIARTLTDDDGKMTMNKTKAHLIEFIVAG